MKENSDWGLLLVRVALGVVFIAHGVVKFMDLAGTGGFFESLGLPAFMATVIAVVETFGGLGVLFGIYPRISAGAIAIVMAGAIVLVKFQMGFLGGYELDFTLLLAALAVLVAGGGRYCLMSAKKKHAGQVEA